MAIFNKRQGDVEAVEIDGIVVEVEQTKAELTLKDFLPANIEKVGEVEVEISERLPKFILKPASQAEVDELNKKVTKKRFAKGQMIENRNSEAFMKELTRMCTVSPDFENTELQEAWGVVGADSLISVMMLPGEVSEWRDKVAKVCGFSDGVDIAELEEEAKN